MKKKKETYVIMEQLGTCETCGRKEGLRLGNCFDCAEAESIILEGKDMRDEGNAKYALEKLRMLIEKGWIPPMRGPEGN